MLQCIFYNFYDKNCFIFKGNIKNFEKQKKRRFLLEMLFSAAVMVQCIDDFRFISRRGVLEFYAWDLIKALVAIVATGVNEAITKPSMKNNSP